MDLSALIRSIPDYPKPGILFRDITTLLGHAEGFRATIDAFAARYAGKRIRKVAGIEARGFILGGALADRLGAGFVPVRKRGKLPHETVGQDYALEYGTDRVEMHVDAVGRGERVLLIDDLIATGGTAEAATLLLRGCGAEVVEACFVIDLPDLGGKARIEKLGVAAHALLAFPGH
jgi:adenine phosphoribosyltransferase